MAIDTRAKRLSMLSFGSMGALLPDPSGSVNAPARATFLGLYAGILLGEPVVVLKGRAGKRPRLRPMRRAHPREAAWNQQMAKVAAQMQDHRKVKVVPTQTQQVRERQLQEIRTKAAEMERERIAGDEVVTRRNLKPIVEEVVEEVLPKVLKKRGRK